MDNTQARAVQEWARYCDTHSHTGTVRLEVVQDALLAEEG